VLLDFHPKLRWELSICSFIYLLNRFQISLINISLEPSSFLETVWKDHKPYTVLDPLFPLSLINRAISPVHLSVPISLIINIVPLVFIPTGPLEDSKPVLAVVQILTIIIIVEVLALFKLFLPLALSTFKSGLKLA
jgi:hypothetical protein